MRPLFSAIALLCCVGIVSVSCNKLFNIDDDDDDVDALSSGDISTLATDSALIVGVFGLTSPAFLDEDYGNEDDCREVTRTENGDSIMVDILLDNCPFELPRREAPFTLTGSWSLDGDTSPETTDVDAFLQQIRNTIPNLDALLMDSGDLLASVDSRSDYEIGLTSRRIDVDDAEAESLLYEDLCVVRTEFEIPFETSQGIKADAEVEAKLVVPNANGIPQDPIGEVEITLNSVGGRVRLERVTLFFDGTELVQFESNLSRQSGTINLQSGDVVFD